MSAAAHQERRIVVGGQAISHVVVADDCRLKDLRVIIDEEMDDCVKLPGNWRFEAGAMGLVTLKHEQKEIETVYSVLPPPLRSLLP